MKRCPVCRGQVSDNAECRRCGADLTLVLGAEQAANDLVEQALVFMSDKNHSQAECLLEKAQSLMFSPFQQQLLGFVKSRGEICLEKSEQPKAVDSYFSRLFSVFHYNKLK